MDSERWFQYQALDRESRELVRAARRLAAGEEVLPEEFPVIGEALLRWRLEAGEGGCD